MWPEIWRLRYHENSGEFEISVNIWHNSVSEKVRFRELGSCVSSLLLNTLVDDALYSKSDLSDLEWIRSTLSCRYMTTTPIPICPAAEKMTWSSDLHIQILAISNKPWNSQNVGKKLPGKERTHLLNTLTVEHCPGVQNVRISLCTYVTRGGCHMIIYDITVHHKH